MQIDFSAAFDRVNHQGILYKLCSVGIGGSLLSILTQFLSDRSQHGVNGLMSCPVCRRALFWAHYCTSYTPRSFFLFLRIS